MTRGPNQIYDRAEVAQVALAALAANQPVTVALSTHFNVTRATASRILTRARQAGFDIPYDMRLRDGSVHHRTQYPQAEIVRVACEASGSMARAVAEHFGIEHRRAIKLICRAREAGASIPYQRATYKPATRRLKAADVTGAPVENMARYTHFELVCGCGWSCGVLDGAQTLATHTHTVHKRRPTDVERTPSKIRKKAA